MRPYLKSSQLNSKQKILMFKYRTRMINVKDNFRESHLNLNCKLGCTDQLDDQNHLFSCRFLPNQISTNQSNQLFSNRVDEVIINVVKKLQQNMKVRDQFIEDSREDAKNTQR